MTVEGFDATQEQTMTEHTPKQFCRLQIVFPASNDDEAMAIKKKVGEAIAGIKNAQITFTLATVPYGMPVG